MTPRKPEQLGLLGDTAVTHVRRGGPPTSADAARLLRRATLARQQAAILRVLLVYTDGAICEQVANGVNNLPNRVARRLTDLAQMGYATTSGDTRRASSGRHQMVWRLTPAGRVRASQVDAAGRRAS